MVKETEFYELLKVSVDAEETEIKRSYRRLALQHHPDKNPDNPEAAEMFKKISHAYETLSDPEKRRVYDLHGKEGLEGGAGEGGGGFHSAEDIFSAFFGGGGGRPRGEPRPKDILHELPVSLEDIFRGKTKNITFMRTRLCGACQGEGLRPGAKRTTCPRCRGSGVQIKVQQLFPGFVQQVQSACSQCDGTGETTRSSDLCESCAGQRVVKERAKLEVTIEKGVAKNEVVKFAGEGNQVPGMRLSGDVLILLTQKEHDVFRRVGKHLIMQYTITLHEALCGFELPIVQLDGRTLLVKIPPGQVISEDAAWCVANEGMPLPNTGGMVRGNLYIHFTITWPSQLPRGQVDKIAQAFQVPAKMPQLGGQRVTLVPCVGRRNETSARAQRRAAAGARPGNSSSNNNTNNASANSRNRRNRGGRQSQRRRAQNNEEEEEDEDEDQHDYESEDSEDDAEYVRNFSDGRGQGVHVQMQQCPTQ